MYVHSQKTAFKLPIPWLIGIVFDCTASISNRDFTIAKEQLVNFLVATHVRGQHLSQLPSDFISVTAFKDRHQIFGPPSPLNIVKMDRKSHVIALCQWINNLKNDGSSTAVYDAIRLASAELLEIDRHLPYRYLKMVLVITDGCDNNSTSNLRDLSYFHNSNLCLSVIGVGNSVSSELKSLHPYATSVYSINNFAGLFQAMTISLQMVVERQRLIQF